MESIAAVFGAATQRWTRNPDFRAGMAALAWESVLGRDIAAHVQLVHISHGIGWVQTTSPVWAHQLVYLKADILRQLADKLGPRLITDIRLARGMARPKAPEEPREVVAEPLSTDQIVQIHQCASSVQDAALQHALEKAMAAMLQRQSHLVRQGWLSCLSCGSLTDDTTRCCLLCRLKAEAARHATLVAAMKATPWASLWDLRSALPDVNPREFGRLRALLLKTSWAEAQSFLARNKKADRLPPSIQELLKLHIMLRVQKPWDRIDPITVEHYAGKQVRFLLTRSGALEQPLRG